ncbi:MAG: phosphomannose isomerase type II C-terminal cupin domain [Nanoarchaeota archaeon]|nr:phosphomannose isomerase type II C-terminal cupin domain [Nanoarchaeota archaeon]
MEEKFSVEKPWGKFEQFCKNKSCTIKVLSIKPNEQLSLQYHHFRDEFWRVIQGEAELVIDKKTIKARENDEVVIPKKTLHRIITKNSPVKILEISYGHFDEEDIVRLEDKYGRVK